MERVADIVGYSPGNNTMEPGPEVAAVRSIAGARSTRDLVALLNQMCPGWSVAYLSRPGWWGALRQMGRYFCDASADPESVVITAADPITLYLKISRCAINLPIGQYPEWRVACAGDAWAAELPPDGPLPGGRALCGPSPAALLYAVVSVMAGVEPDGAEPWLDRWGDPRAD